MQLTETNFDMPDTGRVLFLLLYQAGFLITFVALAYQNWGSCVAVFNCVLIIAADLFKAVFWPFYWAMELLL